MSRTVLARRAALAAVTLLALTACGSSEESGSGEPRDDQVAGQEEAGGASDAGGAEEDAETDDAADGAAASDGGEGSEASDGSEEADAAEGADAAAAESTVVEIGTEFTDEETGDVITVVSAVRNNPTEYYEAIDNPDGEMVYLEVSVVPGDAFGGTVSSSDFLLDDGGEEVNYAASADDELTAAGYEYFDSAARRDGEHTGYIPIYLETTGDTLAGAYVRPEMKVLGEDTTIPEFRGEFEIPAS